MIALAVALFAVVQTTSAANALTIKIADSDNVVKAGLGYAINLEVKNGETDNSASYVVEYLTASGGVFVSNVAGSSTNLGVGDEGTLVVPKNAEGTYTVTAGVVRATGAADTLPLRLSNDLSVRVGDVGEAIGSVEVSLGTVEDDDEDNVAKFIDASSSDDEKAASKTDSSTKGEGSIIGVTVKVLNSLGNAPNAEEVKEILIFAPSAYVIPAVEDTQPDAGDIANADNGNSNKGVVGTATSFNFYVHDDEAGTVDVYAVAIGDGGTATSAPLTLTFTGAATTIELGDASGPLAQTGGVFSAPESADDADDGVEADNVVTVEVTAADDSGNLAGLVSKQETTNNGTAIARADKSPAAGNIGDSDVKILDADDEEVDSISARVDPKPKSSTAVLITLAATGAEKTEPGTYTVQVTFAGEKYTTDLVVAGDPASVSLESSQAEGSSIITVSATVTDADGNLVPNATDVEFVAVGTLDLTGLDEDPMTNIATRETKAGVASTRYVITGGSGHGTVIASVPGFDGVDSVITVAGPEAAEAMADEEASVACLSNLAGFSTWSCGVESSASEIFELVSGRGATAIHLWNGSAWVRYSVVDGTMVPGSSDFMVTKSDILYISN